MVAKKLLFRFLFVAVILFSFNTRNLYAQYGDPLGFSDSGSMFGSQASVAVSMIELNSILNIRKAGLKGRVLLHGGDFGVGWEGLLMLDSKQNQQYRYLMSNLFIDVLFLEIWWDGYLGGSFGYAFGEELIGTKSFSGFSSAIFLAGPIIVGGDGFPILYFDLNFSSHLVKKLWDYYHFAGEVMIFPLGGPLRPLGFTIGFSFGEMQGYSFQGLILGISYGAYTIMP